MAKNDIYIATESAVLYVNGTPYVIHKGTTRVREGHVLLERNPGMFAPLDVHYDVEQATAAPGEKRAVSGGGRRRAAKSDQAEE